MIRQQIICLLNVFRIGFACFCCSVTATAIAIAVDINSLQKREKRMLSEALEIKEKDSSCAIYLQIDCNCVKSGRYLLLLLILSMNKYCAS